jgi:sensor histidine kinase YesM
LPEAGPEANRRERIGTSNTRRRLQQLHGKAASFTLENRPGGGACSSVEWPLSPTSASNLA